MRLLWVKAGRILPLDSGGKLRSFHLARHLSSRHDLTFLSYYDGPSDGAYDESLRQAFPEAISMSTGLMLDTTASRGLDYLRRLVNPAPYAVSKFHFPMVTVLLEQWDAERRFDVMICDFLSASKNFPNTLVTPLLLFQHNVEGVLWERQAAVATGLPRRLAYRFEAIKMKRYERATVGRFDHVVAVSESDRSMMTAMTSPNRISIVSTGVDLSHFRSAAEQQDTGPLVVFLGSMDWEPNVDGVLWFADAMWPAVKQAVPNVRFRIVGRNPDAKVRALASDTIEVTGSVPSVVEHLAEAAVVVVPLRIGGGTRLKILEAMAAGRAIVSTTIGAEGLAVRHGHDIVLADAVGDFAREVNRLLTQKDVRTSFGLRAAETARRFDWSAVVKTFEHSLEMARQTKKVRGSGIT